MQYDRYMIWDTKLNRYYKTNRKNSWPNAKDVVAIYKKLIQYSNNKNRYQIKFYKGNNVI